MSKHLYQYFNMKFNNVYITEQSGKFSFADVKIGTKVYNKFNRNKSYQVSSTDGNDILLKNLKTGATITVTPGMERNYSLTESINESNYIVGAQSYTDKNLTPTDILDLAFLYSKLNIVKLPKKIDNRIKIFTDLKKLIGMDYNYVNKKLEKSSKPALILFLLKNDLVSKDEYIKLYKSLITLTDTLGKVIESSKKERSSTAAAAAARKDMKGEFETENINEVKYHPNFVKVIKKYIELTDPDKDGELSSSEEKWIDTVEDDGEKNGYFKDLRNASYKSHYGRVPIQASDKLKNREWWAKMNKDSAITKGGKLNKNVAKGIKNRIKSDRNN